MAVAREGLCWGLETRGGGSRCKHGARCVLGIKLGSKNPPGCAETLDSECPFFPFLPPGFSRTEAFLGPAPQLCSSGSMGGAG